MKRIVIALIVLLATTSLIAGEGKSCDMSKSKNVELTGTFVAEGEKTLFRVSDGSETYSVCHKTKSAVLDLAKKSSGAVKIKGKLVSCGGGQELMIDDAKKI